MCHPSLSLLLKPPFTPSLPCLPYILSLHPSNLSCPVCSSCLLCPNPTCISCLYHMYKIIILSLYIFHLCSPLFANCLSFRFISFLFFLLPSRVFLPESIERFMDDYAFSPSYDLAPLSSQQVVSLSRSSCVSPVELTNGRGGRG